MVSLTVKKSKRTILIRLTSIAQVLSLLELGHNKIWFDYSDFKKV